MRFRWPAFQDPVGRSRFARNFLQVARANLLAQALPLLAAPLLTRLYEPADFGALAVFAAGLGVCLAVGTGRFDWSVPNARSSGMAAALLMLGAMLLGALTIAVGLVMLFGAPALPASWRHLGAAGWLLPLALLGGGLQQLLQAWHVRDAELSAVGRAKVTQSIATVGVSLAAAPLLAAAGAMGAMGLVGGVLAGSWAGLWTLWARTEALKRALTRLTVQRVASAWRRFRAEAAWSTLASLANTLSFALVPLLLARHYGVAEVGYYALMQRVALGPIGLIGAAVSQSFWAEAAQLMRSDPAALARLYKRSTLRLAWVALPLSLLALAGPWYVGPLFGSGQWADAGWVLAASVPLLIGQAVASPLSHLVIHRKQHWQATWDAVRMLVLAVAIEASAWAGLGFSWIVFVVSLVMAAMYLVLVLMNLRALRMAGA